MLGYDYEITYKKRTNDVVVNALSKQNSEDHTSQIMAIFEVVPTWIQVIMTSYEEDMQI